MKLRLTLLFAATFLAISSPASARVWTDVRGNSMEAKFVRVNNGNVVLRRGQKVVQFPVVNFSQEDQLYVWQELKKQGNENLLPPTVPTAEGERIWTGTKGQKFSAKYEGFAEEKIQLARDGETRSIPYTDFSEEDQEYVRKQLEATGQAHLLPKKPEPPKPAPRPTRPRPTNVGGRPTRPTGAIPSVPSIEIKWQCRNCNRILNDGEYYCKVCQKREEAQRKQAEAKRQREVASAMKSHSRPTTHSTARKSKCMVCGKSISSKDKLCGDCDGRYSVGGGANGSDYVVWDHGPLPERMARWIFGILFLCGLLGALWNKVFGS